MNAEQLYCFISSIVRSNFAFYITIDHRDSLGTPSNAKKGKEKNQVIIVNQESLLKKKHIKGGVFNNNEQ